MKGEDPKLGKEKFFLDRVKNTKQANVRKMSIEELRKSAFHAEGTSLLDKLQYDGTEAEKAVARSTEEKLDHVAASFEDMHSYLLQREAALKETFETMERSLNELEGEIHKLGPRLRNRERALAMETQKSAETEEEAEPETPKVTTPSKKKGGFFSRFGRK